MVEKKKQKNQMKILKLKIIIPNVKKFTKCTWQKSQWTCRSIKTTQVEEQRENNLKEKKKVLVTHRTISKVFTYYTSGLSGESGEENDNWKDTRTMTNGN